VKKAAYFDFAIRMTEPASDGFRRSASGASQLPV
jgi:hypothetical protein